MRDMQLDTLIRSPSYQVTGANGCCGIGTIARLSAVKIPDDGRITKAVEIYMGREKPTGYFQRNPTWKRDYKMKQIITAIGNEPSSASNSPGANCIPWNGCPITTEIAFVSLLEYLSRHMKHVAYYLSDNVEGSGDVYLGPFNTQDFHTWFILSNLGVSVTSGPMKSLKTGRQLQAWIIQPHWGNVAKLVTKFRPKLIKIVEEINNHGNIKSRRQAAIASRVVAREELQLQLSAW